MSIDRYAAKRDFDKTPEPKASDDAGTPKGAKAASFVVHKHAARRLHYDLRLEMDGVLKSWAVTLGPSLVTGEKRLSVHVEDHPLAYGGFEGVIPPKQYGAGNVIIWDRGTWVPIADAKRGYAKGHLEFALEGDKLKGRFHLVRIQGRRKGDGKADNWLLIKADDEFAREDGAPDILEERPESVVSGAMVETVGEAAGKPCPLPSALKRAAAQKSTLKSIAGARKAKLPDFVPPALATLSAKAPTRGRWLHEIKFDGYRIQARIDARKISLLTRTGLDWTERFGTAIPAAFGKLDVHTALIDGEIVVEKANGSSDFSALQSDLSEGRSDRFVFYAFDLMHLDGEDLTKAALIDRKSALARLFSGQAGAARYSEHFEEDGDLVFRHACRLSLEGVISKKRDEPYRSGRSRAWLKSKCSHRQEFVVGGFVPSSADPQAVGSLVLGVHDEKGGLRHVGRVGTGFTRSSAAELFSLLTGKERKTRPFVDALDAAQRRDVRFVRADTVVEVEFAGWTGAGHLRHAAYRGIREDKPAKDIVAETGPGSSSDRPSKRQPGMGQQENGAAEQIVKLTHPDKLYWPADGIAKGDLAQYYADIWRVMGPLIVNRPLSLLRGPDGIGADMFYQKHGWRGMHKAIRTLDGKGARGSKSATESLVWIDGLDGLLGLVQGGALEIHPWGATLNDIEKPDMLTMDIDPDMGLDWPLVAEAALDIKERLEAAGLAAFVKTSGGKGLHVVSPLKPSVSWPQLKAFTKSLAQSMAGDRPERYVATVSKAKRRGKILIDYLRNGRGATAVAAYSTRARPHAPVSMPLGWDEITDLGDAAAFTLSNVRDALADRDHDPWADFEAARRPVK